MTVLLLLGTITAFASTDKAPPLELELGRAQLAREIAQLQKDADDLRRRAKEIEASLGPAQRGEALADTDTAYGPTLPPGWSPAAATSAIAK
ncbi:MAG: hypothetical protein HY075_01590 [Deltaproteobacteria bacterium]|nr:hypothetical protein [Deltaproteobacteria bacterium]